MLMWADIVFLVLKRLKKDSHCKLFQVQWSFLHSLYIWRNPKLLCQFTVAMLWLDSHSSGEGFSQCSVVIFETNFAHLEYLLMETCQSSLFSLIMTTRLVPKTGKSINFLDLTQWQYLRNWNNNLSQIPKQKHYFKSWEQWPKTANLSFSPKLLKWENASRKQCTFLQWEIREPFTLIGNPL